MVTLKSIELEDTILSRHAEKAGLKRTEEEVSNTPDTLKRIISIGPYPTTEMARNAAEWQVGYLQGRYSIFFRRAVIMLRDIEIAVLQDKVNFTSLIPAPTDDERNLSDTPSDRARKLEVLFTLDKLGGMMIFYNKLFPQN